jgi:hypothetical protein
LHIEDGKGVNIFPLQIFIVDYYRDSREDCITVAGTRSLDAGEFLGIELVAGEFVGQDG